MQYEEILESLRSWRQGSGKGEPKGAYPIEIRKLAAQACRAGAMLREVVLFSDLNHLKT